MKNKLVIALFLIALSGSAFSADKKISAMTDGGALSSGDVIPVVRGAGTYKTTYTPTSIVLTSYGDSSTASSSYVSDAPYSYVDMLGLYLNVPPNSSAYGGDLSCDGAVKAFSRPIPPSAPYLVNTVNLGVNDAATKGAGAYELNYINCLSAMSSFLAIPEASKIYASTATQTGTWSASASLYGPTPVYSVTNGSTQTYNVTATSNGVIIGWYRTHDGDGGTFSVSVDGGAAVNYSTAPATGINTQNGGHYGAAPIVLTGLTAGSHDIVVTVTSATNAANTVEVVGFSPVPTTTTQKVKVYVSGVIKQQYNSGSAGTTAYNSDAGSVVTTYAGYGLPIEFVDVQSYVNTSTDMFNTLHPSNAGISHLYDAFFASMSDDSLPIVENYSNKNTYRTPANDKKGYSVGIGTGSLIGETIPSVYYNTAVGSWALSNGLNSAAIKNTAVGYRAIYNLKSGNNNTAVGNEALGSNSINVGIVNNTAVGSKALYTSGAGNNNAFGALALSSDTTGGNNNAFGTNACQGVTTGSGNLCIGHQVGNTKPTTGSNNILIGVSNGVQTTDTGTSNFINIGNAIIAESVTGGTNTSPKGYVFVQTIKTMGYTVGTLPPGSTGMRAYVTDQLSACAVTGAALTGGGAVTCPVFYNGTAWVGG